MDLLDEADREREQHLKAALSRREPGLPRIGSCHNCYQPLADGVRKGQQQRRAGDGAEASQYAEADDPGQEHVRSGPVA